MIKLFAILTVLASLPVSALAEQVQISKSAGIHCTKDAADVPFVRSVADAPVVKTGDAAVAQ